MHVRGMCKLALVALARLENGQAKFRKTSKGCISNTHVMEWSSGTTGNSATLGHFISQFVGMI